MIVVIFYAVVGELLIWLLAQKAYQRIHVRGWRRGLFLDMPLETAFIVGLGILCPQYAGGPIIALMLILVAGSIFKELKRTKAFSSRLLGTNEFWSNLLIGRRYLVFISMMFAENGTIGATTTVVGWYIISYLIESFLSRIDWRNRKTQEFATFLMYVVMFFRIMRIIRIKNFYITIVVVAGIIGAVLFRPDDFKRMIKK